MKINTIKKVVLCIALLLSGGTAFGFTQIFPGATEGQTSIGNKGSELSASTSAYPGGPSINIETSESGIILNVENSFLADVLQKIANEINIQFDIGSQLTSHRITVNIQGPNWDSVLETLLKDFSRITVGGENSAGVKEIRLLGKNNWDSQESFETTSHDNQTREQAVSSAGLSVSQLRRLIRVPLGNSLPRSLFADLKIRNYLKLKGIHSPEEWKQPKKARIALHSARKELKRLLYAKQIKLKANY